MVRDGMVGMLSRAKLRPLDEEKAEALEERVREPRFDRRERGPRGPDSDHAVVVEDKIGRAHV